MSRSVVSAMLVMLSLALLSAPALAGVANAGLAGASRQDPLAGLPWGNYTGPLGDEVFPAYRAAGGQRRRLLGSIALRPRMRWFGSWYPDADAEHVARQYVEDVTGGAQRCPQPARSLVQHLSFSLIAGDTPPML